MLPQGVLYSHSLSLVWMDDANFGCATSIPSMSERMTSLRSGARVPACSFHSLFSSFVLERFLQHWMSNNWVSFSFEVRADSPWLTCWPSALLIEPHSHHRFTAYSNHRRAFETLLLEKWPLLWCTERERLRAASEKLWQGLEHLLKEHGSSQYPCCHRSHGSQAWSALDFLKVLRRDRMSHSGSHNANKLNQLVWAQLWQCFSHINPAWLLWGFWQQTSWRESCVLQKLGHKKSSSCTGVLCCLDLSNDDMQILIGTFMQLMIRNSVQTSLYICKLLWTLDPEPARHWRLTVPQSYMDLTHIAVQIILVSWQHTHMRNVQSSAGDYLVWTISWSTEKIISPRLDWWQSDCAWASIHAILSMCEVGRIRKDVDYTVHMTSPQSLCASSCGNPIWSSRF